MGAISLKTIKCVLFFLCFSRNFIILKNKKKNKLRKEKLMSSARRFRFPLWVFPAAMLTLYTLITTVPIAFISDQTARVVYCFVAGPLLILVAVVVFNIVFKETFEDMSVAASRILDALMRKKQDDGQRGITDSDRKETMSTVTSLVNLFPSDSRFSEVHQTQQDLIKLLRAALDVTVVSRRDYGGGDSSSHFSSSSLPLIVTTNPIDAQISSSTDSTKRNFKSSGQNLAATATMSRNVRFADDDDEQKQDRNGNTKSKNLTNQQQQQISDTISIISSSSSVVAVVASSSNENQKNSTNDHFSDNEDDDEIQHHNDDDDAAAVTLNDELVTCISGVVPVVIKSRSQSEVAPIFSSNGVSTTTANSVNRRDFNDPFYDQEHSSPQARRPKTAKPSAVAAENDDANDNHNNMNHFVNEPSSSSPSPKLNKSSSETNNNQRNSPFRLPTTRKDPNASVQNNLPYRFIEEEDRKRFQQQELQEARKKKKEQEDDEQRARDEALINKAREDEKQQQQQQNELEQERLRQKHVEQQDRILIEKSNGKNSTNAALNDWRNDRGDANYSGGIHQRSDENERRDVSVTSSVASNPMRTAIKQSNADITAVLALLRYQRGRRFPGDNHNICFYISRSTNQNVVVFEAKFDRRNPSELDISNTLDIFWLEVDQKFMQKNREKAKISDRSELTYHERSLAYGAHVSMDVEVPVGKDNVSLSNAANNTSRARSASTATATNTQRRPGQQQLNNNDHLSPEFLVRLVALPTRPMRLSILSRYSNMGNHGGGSSLFRNAIPVLRCRIAGEENCIAEKLFLHTTVPSTSMTGPPRVTQISLHGFREDTLESVVELIET